MSDVKKLITHRRESIIALKNRNYIDLFSTFPKMAKCEARKPRPPPLRKHDSLDWPSNNYLLANHWKDAVEGRSYPIDSQPLGVHRGFY